MWVGVEIGAASPSGSRLLLSCAHVPGSWHILHQPGLKIAGIRCIPRLSATRDLSPTALSKLRESSRASHCVSAGAAVHRPHSRPRGEDRIPVSASSEHQSNRRHDRSPRNYSTRVRPLLPDRPARVVGLITRVLWFLRRPRWTQSKRRPAPPTPELCTNDPALHATEPRRARR